MAEKNTLLEARERPKGQAKQFGNAKKESPKQREIRIESEARFARRREYQTMQYGTGRAAAMAQIDEALIQTEKGKSQPEPEHGPASVLPDEKGMPAALPGATPDYDTKAPPPPPETEEEAKVRKAQEDLLGKENAERLREEQRKEEERRRTLLGIVENVAGNARESGGKVASRLAGLPTPGSLWFPLVLLLIFFFILITYNGHTRLVWAWLVLTNNAGFNLGGQGQVTPQQSGDTGEPTVTTTGSVSASGIPHMGQPF